MSYSLNAGWRITARNKVTGLPVSVYNTAEAGMDIDGGKWMAVCETHSANVGTSTQARALSAMRDVMSWCADCRKKVRA